MTEKTVVVPDEFWEFALNLLPESEVERALEENVAFVVSRFDRKQKTRLDQFLKVMIESKLSDDELRALWTRGACHIDFVEGIRTFFKIVRRHLQS